MNIVFSTNNHVMSYLIRKATKSEVSHVSIRYSGDESHWMVEAKGGEGVAPGWWNYFLKKNKVVGTYKIKNIEERDLEKIVDDCLDIMIGKHYDYLAVFGILITYIVKKITGKEIKNFLGSSKNYFCSEFILRVSKVIEEQSNTKIYEGDFELTSPEDLLKQSKDNEYLELIN